VRVGQRALGLHEWQTTDMIGMAVGEQHQRKIGGQHPQRHAMPQYAVA
jgi:hypothetical protein